MMIQGSIAAGAVLWDSVVRMMIDDGLVEEVSEEPAQARLFNNLLDQPGPTLYRTDLGAAVVVRYDEEHQPVTSRTLRESLYRRQRLEPGS